MEFWINQTFNGISYAALLFLFGGGMSLIFGVMRIVNIAHGIFYLVGAYVGYVVVRSTGNFYLGILVACVVVAAIGMFLERFLLRAFQGQMLRQMLMTMGITLFFQDLLLVIFKGYPVRIVPPAWTTGTVQIGSYYFHNLRLFMIAAAVITFFILWFVQQKTKAGAVMRAAVDNQQMSQGVGINVNLVTMAVFGLGALLAAFAGVIGGSFTAVYPGLDFEVLPFAFIVVIVGGMGSLTGAVCGSLIVGLIDNFGKALFPELAYFTLFLPMAIVLAIRPQGLFGRK